MSIVRVTDYYLCVGIQIGDSEYNLPCPSPNSYTIEVDDSRSQQFSLDVEIEVLSVNTIPLTSIVTQLLSNKFIPKIDTYFDNLRELKTIVNFENDRQQIATNWKRVSQNQVKLKLLQPLSSDFSENTPIYISRELYEPVVDTIRLIPVGANVVPELRPTAFDTSAIHQQIKVRGTLSELISTISGVDQSGSLKTFVGDGVLERFYNKNKSSLPINVDYSDFNNFVKYGSAEKRIDVFLAKLQRIEELIQIAPTNTISLDLPSASAYSGSYSTIFGTLNVDSSGSTWISPNVTAQASASVTDHINTSISVSLELQELIRSLDDYEYTLWFENSLPYSSSISDLDADDVVYYSDFTYPKILGIPYSTADSLSTTWYSQLNSIASSFDDGNRNRLRKNIPTFIQDDDESLDFGLFLDLIGHHFDNIRLYIVNLSNLPLNSPDSTVENSGEIAALMLESYGFNVPSIQSIEKLAEYVYGVDKTSDSYKTISNEYYKRYVHALPHLLKSKGTSASVTSLLNVFGVNPDFITIKESVRNTSNLTNQIHVSTISETDYALHFNTGSYMAIPFSSSLRNPQTVQFRFSLDEVSDQTICNFDNVYQINTIVHPSASTNTFYSNYGRIEMISASVTEITSSWFDLYDTEPTSVQVRYNSSGVCMDVIKIENEEITYSASIVESSGDISSSWQSFDDLLFGFAPGNENVGPISASLDELRVWTEQVSYSKFEEFAKNPGMYAGNSYTSSLYSLMHKLSFNTPPNASTGSIPNETPYLLVNSSPDIGSIQTFGFEVKSSPYYNCVSKVRKSQMNSYNIGTIQQTTNMISVVPPAYTGSSDVPELHSKKTIANYKKKLQSSSFGDSSLDVSISPIDAVDRDIMRSFGSFNLSNMIGDPLYRDRQFYTELKTAEGLFASNLAPSINYNAFIKYFDKFLSAFYTSLSDLIPARTRLTKGIVIRSNVLNRNKVLSRTKIKHSGLGTRRTNNSLTSMDKDVITSFDDTILLDDTLTSTVFAQHNSLDTSLGTGLDDVVTLVPVVDTGVDVNFSSSLLNPIQEVVSDYNVFEANSIYTTSSIGISSEFCGLSFTTTGFANYDAAVSLNITQQDRYPPYTSTQSVYEIAPYTNFNNIESYTYFYQPNGIYFLDSTRYVAVTSSIMSTPPSIKTWVSGNRYLLGDVVLQPSGTTDSNGNEYSKNGKYFVFTNQLYEAAGGVQSFNVPQTDTTNWVPLQYRKETYQSPQRIAVVDSAGSISLLKSIDLSYLSIPPEYDRTHYRFTRDNSIGARRRTYLGTQNVLSTTADFKPPFESFDIKISTIQVTDKTTSCD